MGPIHSIFTFWALRMCNRSKFFINNLTRKKEIYYRLVLDLLEDPMEELTICSSEKEKQCFKLCNHDRFQIWLDEKMPWITMLQVMMGHWIMHMLESHNFHRPYSRKLTLQKRLITKSLHVAFDVGYFFEKTECRIALKCILGNSWMNTSRI